MAQRVPEGLSSHISWHESGEVVSLTHRPPLPPGMFLVLIFTRGWFGNMSLKNPVAPPGIDPGSVRLVARRLNHYAIPSNGIYSEVYIWNSSSYFIRSPTLLLLSHEVKRLWVAPRCVIVHTHCTVSTYRPPALNGVTEALPPAPKCNQKTCGSSIDWALPFSLASIFKENIYWPCDFATMSPRTPLLQPKTRV